MAIDHPDARSSFVLKRIRLFGALAAVCVLLLLAMIGYGDYRSRHHAIMARTSSQARTLAGHAARTFDVVDVTLAQLADRLGEQWNDPDHANVQRQRLLSHAAAAMHFVRSVEIVSPQGEVLFSFPSGALPSVPPGERTYVQRLLASGLSRLHVGESTGDATRPGQWLIPVSRRIVDSANQPAGVIIAYIDAGFFQTFYDSVGQGGTVDAALVNGTGRILAASSQLRLRDGAYIPSALATLLPGVASAGPDAPSLPREQLGGSLIQAVGLARVEGWPLWAITAYDSDTLTSDWFLHLILLSIIGVVVVLATRQFIRVVAGNLRRLDLTEAELRRRVEDLEVSQNLLEQQSAEMVGLAEQIAQARDDAEQARHAADLANQAKSDFLARMSHELRTPLNAILGFSEIMKERVPGLDRLETYADYASDIHESGSHLLSVINDILDLSKVEAGRFELGEEPVDLRRMAVGAARLVREAALRRNVALEIEIADGLPCVLSEQRVVKQMLLNLLSNALKFTAQGGKVAIAAARRDDGVAVTVRDTGIGIDRKDFAKVMEPFGQVKGVGLEGSRGTGLGLPLVKSFIELHGGRFELDSEAGHGTTVTLWFPPERTVSGSGAGEGSHGRRAAG